MHPFVQILAFPSLLLSLFFLERVSWVGKYRLKVLRPELSLDIIYLLQNSLIRPLPVFLAWILYSSGLWTMPATAPIAPGLAFLVSLIQADLGIYLGHKILHKVFFLWSGHKTHHTIRVFDVLASQRFHFFDQLIYTGFFLIGMYVLVIRFHWPYRPFLLGYFVTNLWEVFIHSNINTPFPLNFFRCLGRVFILPESHRLHHVEKFQEMNFGNMFSIWDQIAGEYAEPQDVDSMEMGIASEPGYQDSYVQQVFNPILAKAVTLPQGLR